MSNDLGRRLREALTDYVLAQAWQVADQQPIGDDLSAARDVILSALLPVTHGAQEPPRCVSEFNGLRCVYPQHHRGSHASAHVNGYATWRERETAPPVTAQGDKAPLAKVRAEIQSWCEQIARHPAVMVQTSFDALSRVLALIDRVSAETAPDGQAKAIKLVSGMTLVDHPGSPDLTAYVRAWNEAIDTAVMELETEWAPTVQTSDRPS